MMELILFLDDYLGGVKGGFRLPDHTGKAW